jgi:hypothetical protein
VQLHYRWYVPAFVAAALLSACAVASAADPEGIAATDGAPRLELRRELDAATAGAVLALPSLRAPDAGPPACVGDWCQARVDVPGIEISRGRPSKTELFVALLDRSHVEPIASIAWFFVATGLRFDWTPASMDQSFGATAGGWGNVFVRLRLRIDAFNRPTVAMRPRDRMRQERELAAERERAAQAERLRAVLELERLHAEPELERDRPQASHRPARLSST